MTRSRKAQSGFTLLEMIVAMVLSALVSMIGAMALGAGADFYARSGLRQHSYADLKAAERSLRTEWEARGATVALTPTTLEFDTTTPASVRALPGLTSVRYRCEEAGGGRFQLERQVKAVDAQWRSPETTDRANGLQSADRTQPMGPEVMSSALRGCGFAALSSKLSANGQSQPSWVDLWNAKDAPPQLLRLQLDSDLGALPAMVFVARKR